MYQFPIKYYEDNLIFNENLRSCCACYRLLGFNYDFLSDDKQISVLNRTARFIANLGREAKILIIPVGQNVEEHYAEINAKLDRNDPLCETAEIHAEGVKEYLKSQIQFNGNSNEYEVYVIVNITRPESFGDMLDLAVRRPRKALEELFGVERKEILYSEKRAFEEAADAWYRDQTKRITLKKTDEATTQWLIRRMLRRGITESAVLRKEADGSIWKPKRQIVLRDGEKAVRPEQRDILTLTEGLIEPTTKYVKVTNTDGKVSYQAFLSIAHIPDGLVFPGGEWLLILQDYPIASEVCMYIKTIEYKDSLRKIAGKRQEIKSQTEHVAENDSVPDELLEAAQSVDALEAELKPARDPLLELSVSICLASETEEELERQVNFIRNMYQDANFVVERPMTDQFKLFMEFIPGSGRYLSDYILRLPPRTVAGSMFSATRLLGDSVGHYIGTTGKIQHFVYLDMGLACQLNRSASAVFLGTLGGGKSYNANLLVYHNVIYGGSALIFDPKGERSNWIKDIPELSDYISITTLSAGEEDIGKLDPFLIHHNDLTAAGELAKSVICELFHLLPKDDEYIVLLEAIDSVKESANPCMSALEDRLNQFSESDDLYKDAKRLARRIKNIHKSGMARLLFGTGKEQGLSFQNRLNILQIQNLQMPEPTTLKENYTQEELMSTVLMLPIASFANQFAMSDRSIFKLVLFDESWALSSTEMGSKLMNALARMGRSLNAGCIFVGHSVTDLKGDGIKNAITYKFCFRSVEREEIKRTLQFLDLEITEENIETILKLEDGECLFKDLEGRVGVLQFDAVYEHLTKAFDTTPRSSELECDAGEPS